MRGAQGKRWTDDVAPGALAVLLVAILVLAVVPRAQADITYVYDEIGRLIGVVDPASDTAVYSYDGVGNLLSIARYASSTVSIIDFQPKSGPVGTVVTIYGTGFSATPASNTVTFNGTSATVSSATPTSLVVSVPAGATTGPIAVTAPGGSATSSNSFVVAAGDSPTISSFSPTIGLPGTTVTISGTNFETVKSNNKVSFYGLPLAKALVTAATTSALDAVVRIDSRSGPIRVATPGGTAVSATDFFVPVGGFTPAQVVFTGRIVIGGASVNVPMLSTGKQALILFDGIAGQRLNLGTELTSGFGTPGVTIYRPDGIVLGTTGSSTARYFAQLPISGVYTIALQNGTATHTVKLTLSEEVVATGVVGGSMVNLSITRAGQRARVNFAGTAGQRIDAAMTQSVTGSTVYFKAPDETTLVSLGIGGSPGELHSPPLPSSGTHFFVIEPTSAATGSFSVTLSEEVAASITIDGASVPISITRAGQRARVTFTGTSGQGPSLGITSATVAGSVTVYRPNGTVHLGPSGYSTPAAAFDFVSFPITGTYEILVDPTAIGTGSLTLWLSQPILATTALDGSGLFVNIARPGQRAMATFLGTATHRASHNLSGTISGQMILLRPDTGLLLVAPLSGFVEPYVLPQTGTYYMFLDPHAANTGTVSVTSYNVPADATGSLSINGGTTSVSLSVPGQNAILSFSGAGQAATIRITNNSFGCILVVLTKPAGGGTSSMSSCSANFNFSVSLGTGAHTIKIDPSGAATGGATVEVTVP